MIDCAEDRAEVAREIAEALNQHKLYYPGEH